MSDADRLHQLQSEFESVLEERITHLLGHVKAAQEVTAQLAATSAEIRRQEQIQASLEESMESLSNHEKSLGKDNDKLQKKVDALKANIRKMRARRQELAGEAKTLAAQSKRDS